MAMHFFNLSPTQKQAASQIYSGFYDYAIGKGADSVTANDFANMGVGVASGEGLAKPNPWSTNNDVGVTALGPFQLNLDSGVGSDYGLNASSPPSAQINAAADTMWNGSSDTYNTQPWNAVGDTPGSGGHLIGNDTAAGQGIASQIGGQFSSKYGFGSDGGAPSSSTSVTNMTPEDMAAHGVDANGNPVAGGNLPGPLSNGLGLGGAKTDSNSLNPTPSAQQTDQMKSPASATSGDLFNGAPVYLTDPHGVASEAGKSVQEGATKAGTDIKAGLGTTASSINDASAQAGGITQYFGNLFYNLLPRLGIITMGIILIGGAFIIMGFEQARKTA